MANEEEQKKEDELISDLLYNYVSVFHQVFPYYEWKKSRKEMIDMIEQCLKTKKPYRGR